MKTLTPQFTLDDLYRSPFNRQRALDPVTGKLIYTPIERQEKRTGIELLDGYIDMLNSSSAYSHTKFALEHGLSTLCFGFFIYALTGLTATEFQRAYMMRKADDLLRYTRLGIGEVARSCGWPLGSFCRIIKAKYHQTPADRRWNLRKVGDRGRYAT